MLLGHLACFHAIENLCFIQTCKESFPLDWTHYWHLKPEKNKDLEAPNYWWKKKLGHFRATSSLLQDNIFNQLKLSVSHSASAAFNIFTQAIIIIEHHPWHMMCEKNTKASGSRQFLTEPTTRSQPTTPTREVRKNK